MSTTALVGTRHFESHTWRDDAGLPVSGAQTAFAYCYRFDTAPIAVGMYGEQPPGSGAYLWGFTPLIPGPHHLWLQLYHPGTGASRHLATTIDAVSAALPIAHVVGVAQERLWVLLDPAGTPIHGATFRVVPGSVLAPTSDDPTIEVVATPRDGAYLIRSTPLGAGYQRAELETTNLDPVQRTLLDYDAAPAGPPLPEPVSPASGSVAWTVAVANGVVTWTEVP